MIVKKTNTATKSCQKCCWTESECVRLTPACNCTGWSCQLYAICLWYKLHCDFSQSETFVVFTAYFHLFNKMLIFGCKIWWYFAVWICLPLLSQTVQRPVPELWQRLSEWWRHTAGLQDSPEYQAENNISYEACQWQKISQCLWQTQSGLEQLCGVNVLECWGGGVTTVWRFLQF